MSSFIEGLVAGFGIAIPFGPISILIINTSLQMGLQHGLAAGMGAASADLIFAAISAMAGAIVSAAISPFAHTVQLISALFLIALGIWGLGKVIQPYSMERSETPVPSNPIRTYLTLLALTILNPITIAYFTALILRKGSGQSFSPDEIFLFVLGAGAASFTWQCVLATLGHVLQRRTSDTFRRVVTVTGNLVILGFGLSALIQS